jgi:hypothetical protein
MSVVRAETWRGLSPPLIFLLSMGIAPFSPRAAVLFWLFIAPVSLVGRRLVAS